MRSRPGLLPDVPPLAPLPPPAEPLTAAWRWIAVLVIALYVGLSAGHIVTTPVLQPAAGSLINAPDEPAHWGYIRILAQEGRLPRRGDATYEWHQPPLYYAIAAPLSSLGPHAVRWLTMAFGLASVWIIFLTSRRLFPSDPVVAVLAMGLPAMLPMRQAVYGAIGNDALLEMFCSAFFFALVPAFTHGFTLRRAVFLGLLLGAALLTKANAVLLVALAIAALYFLCVFADEARRAVLLGGAVLFAVACTVTIPMFVRNEQLYGQPFPIQAFKEEFAGTKKASDMIGKPMGDNLWTGELTAGEPLTRGGYFRLVSNWSLRTFVAAYTPVPLAAVGLPVFEHPPIFYVPHALLGLLALAGLTRLHLRRGALSSTQLAFVRMMIPFTVVVAVTFLGFVWTYFQAQGRYLYPAMLPMSILGALGLRTVVPAVKRDGVTLGILALLALLACAFYFVFVQPSYG